MSDQGLIVAFTGHRPNKIGGFSLPNPTYLHICQQLDAALRQLQPSRAISGMALGIDQWAANICVKLSIPFTAAIPFLGQEKKWPQESQRIYRNLLAKAAEQVIVCEGAYSPEKMQRRNEWMCNHADIVLAVWDGSQGGTGNCVQYARSINKPIRIIDPRLPSLTTTKE